jgi:uncharacterized membrane protein YgcG
MKRSLVFVVALAALAAPAGALASGVVIKVQPARHLVAVARTPSSVALVHTQAASKLKVGQRIDITARTLRNGTLAASHVSVLGRSHKVHFRGMLLARSHSKAVVSAGGAVISLRMSSRSTASARDTTPPPAPGSQVDVTATVAPTGALDDDDLSVFSPTSPGGSIEGSLTLGTGSITVTSEHMSLVIKLPAGFDTTGFTAGQEVLAVFAQQPDGSLLLTKLSGDDNAQQADNRSHDDGDHHGDGGGDGGDHGGGGGGGGDGGGGDD